MGCGRGAVRLLFLCTFAALASVSAQETQIERKPRAGNEKYNYGQTLYLSFLFYEAQRSGYLPANNRVPWRGNSALNDGRDVGLDLTGGWYDAGDHVKFGQPMAASATFVMWGILEYYDAYQDAGELDRALDSVRWPLEYFVKAHPNPSTFYAQVGNGDQDHRVWGPPERMNMDRPSYRVTPSSAGTEPVGDACAALAVGYILFRNSDPTFADRMLVRAWSLWNLANNNQAQWRGSDPFYRSWSGYKDELAWAALWMYIATSDGRFLTYGRQYTAQFGQADEFSWDNKGPGIQLLLWLITREQTYAQKVQQFGDSWIRKTRTPRGLSYHSDWAPLRYVSNTAFLLLVAADNGIQTDTYRHYAVSQIHYILGDSQGGVNPQTGNPRFSYNIGLGDTFPTRPHHRAASCNAQGQCSCGRNPFPHILYGALVGGPDNRDGYSDDCGDYVKNEVATDYNAGFTSAVAGIKHLALTNQLKAEYTIPSYRIASFYNKALYKASIESVGLRDGQVYLADHVRTFDGIPDPSTTTTADMASESTSSETTITQHGGDAYIDSTVTYADDSEGEPMIEEVGKEWLTAPPPAWMFPTAEAQILDTNATMISSTGPGEFAAIHTFPTDISN